MNRQTNRGFTLVELLVVIAIIGIVMSLLLPAIQAVRESGRRAQCQNNLKQFGLALQNYHDVYKRFPSGYLRPNFAFWTSAILPYVEQNNQYDALDFNVKSAWSQPGNRNVAALQSEYELFQCPSASNDIVKHFIPDRVPSNYLACASGLVARESGPSTLAQLNQPQRDGFMYDGSVTRMGDMHDGTSSVVAVGEAVNFFVLGGRDHWGIRQLIDHWPIASPSFGPNEVSEVLGTTAAQINQVFDESPSIYVEERELCFSSNHVGGAQAVLADGHVDFFQEEIDLSVWSALGTRNNNEVAQVP